ncbi:MAG: T9SS type A sorting domain-containing protein [Candidatus Methylacidiphilales bacterium]
MFGQNTYENFKDSTYATDFIINNDTVYTISAYTYKLATEQFPTKRSIIICSSYKGKILNIGTVDLKDTIFAPHQIFIYQNELFIIYAYDVVHSLDKGICLVKINKSSLTSIESSFFTFNQNNNFYRVDEKYELLKCSLVGNELIGVFNADTTKLSPFILGFNQNTYPVLFNINIQNKTIKINELYDQLWSKAYSPIAINDSLFKFYTVGELGTKIITFNKQLEVKNIDNKFGYFDTFNFNTTPIDYIKAIKLNSNIFVSGNADTIWGIKIRNRMSLTKMDLDNNVITRKSFYDKSFKIIIDDEINYFCGFNNSLYFLDNKIYFMYYYENFYNSVIAANKIYLKILDTSLNVLKETEIALNNSKIYPTSIKISNNTCYILGTFYLPKWASKTFLLELDLNKLTTSTKDFEQNKINIFPNPATSQINITSNSNIKTVLIYNVAGQLVKELNYENEHLKNVSLAIDDLAQGMYMVQIIDELDAKLTSKFIKE